MSRIVRPVFDGTARTPHSELVSRSQPRSNSPRAERSR